MSIEKMIVIGSGIIAICSGTAHLLYTIAIKKMFNDSWKEYRGFITFFIFTIAFGIFTVIYGICLD
ncbi:MAG: hypothetical protein WBH77_10040 [Saccharofermentanales bacterium]